ncbi:MAG TPA: YlbF family regulator [Tetragenococcus sp.]|nr:YlbF family regulator [Tetragenococcus sp.]
MGVLKEERAISQQLTQLVDQLRRLDLIKEYKQIESEAKKSQELIALEEKIKKAQKAAVHFDYYEKPQAARQKNQEIDHLKKEYDSHPLVVTYRQKLMAADELLQYITEDLERKVNHAIEEEEIDASKD